MTNDDLHTWARLALRDFMRRLLRNMAEQKEREAAQLRRLAR